MAVLNLNPNLRAEPPSRSPALPQNGAFLSSPRTREEFPALARTPFPGSNVRPQAVRVWTGALKASPRVLEEFPELSRLAPSRARADVSAVLPRNRAYLAAPRTLEEFPALGRDRVKLAGSLANGLAPTLAGVSK